MTRLQSSGFQSIVTEVLLSRYFIHVIEVHNQLTLSKGDYPNLGEPDPISSKALENRAEASLRTKRTSCLWMATSPFARVPAGSSRQPALWISDLPHVPPQLCKPLPCRKSPPTDLPLVLFLWFRALLQRSGFLYLHTGCPMKPCLRSRWPSRPPGLPTVLPVGIDTSYVLLFPDQPGPGAPASQGTAKLKEASKPNLRWCRASFLSALGNTMMAFIFVLGAQG